MVASVKSKAGVASLPPNAKLTPPYDTVELDNLAFPIEPANLPDAIEPAN